MIFKAVKEKPMKNLWMLSLANEEVVKKVLPLKEKGRKENETLELQIH